MRTLRPVILVLGLVLIAGGTAYAATPEEQAAYRAQARALTEQARSFDQQSFISLDLASQIFLAEFRKVDALQDQADNRRVTAYQKWLQGGAPKQAQASLLRQSARSLQLEASNIGTSAALTDIRAASPRARANQYRAGAEALLAGTPDAETKAIARELNQQAVAEDREAKRLENESKALRKKQESTTKRADSLMARAVELEASSPS